FGALPLRRALLLPLGDRFTDGVGRGLELLLDDRVDDDIRLELGPRQTNVRQFCSRSVRIRDRDERFGLLQESHRALPVGGAQRGQLVPTGQLRLLDRAKLGSRAASGHFITRTLRNGGERLAAVDSLERRHGYVGILSL